VPPPTIHISTECGHRFRDRSNFCARALATAYSHAALGENVVSSIAKFEFSRLIFDRLDEFLRNNKWIWQRGYTSAFGPPLIQTRISISL